MERSEFAAILPIIVGGLANKISSEICIGDDQAIEALYNSELYSVLANEETKVWTYSVPKLFDLFQQESVTGCLELPEY